MGLRIWRKREVITMLARGPRPSLFEVPHSFRQHKTWRKREGIEPTGDISASRPDLKSGGATSAPSASVENKPPPPQGGGITSALPFPLFGASSNSSFGVGGGVFQ